MRARACALVASVGLGALASAAHADEQYFGYTYSAEVLGKGASETELWITDRRYKDSGHYDAQDYRIELEHGFTDRLTISGYLNLESHHVDGLEPDFEDVDRNFGFQGLSTEIKYNVLSPFKDGIGLTLYAEPAWSRILSVEGERGTEYELELKAILQKNFLDDRLVWATNFTFEPEWERETKENPLTGGIEKQWNRELTLEITSGLSYRFAPRWYAGVEGRYTSLYPDWTDNFHRETYALFAGPAIHYAGSNWWATLTYLPQLHGSPSPNGGLALDEYEKRQLRLKLGYNF